MQLIHQYCLKKKKNKLWGGMRKKCCITNPLPIKENNSIWKNPDFNDLAPESDSGKSRAEGKGIL